MLNAVKHLIRKSNQLDHTNEFPTPSPIGNCLRFIIVEAAGTHIYIVRIDAVHQPVLLRDAP